ncbi:hypothetical protein [Paragemmobacter straminiformis]|uniref:Uncharacterized protein n=1 Tax=Paragemmobacter straminiformis TaxID=2045119 RepID=A0A842IBD7_9RHOB|nr:hypothetical protein [Gemmobacter straminiformis]MBC2836667.1 hypothetical protein [Gemmobacter straminiformis]
MRHAMYLYAWDLWHEGTAAVTARLCDAGLDGVALATAYHAGRFLRPHAPRERVYLPEDGTVYFQPSETGYGRLKPQAAAMLRDCDPLPELAARAPGLAVAAWTVGLHNSRLGTLHPDLACQTPFGDPLVNALCPSQPEVRAYLVALCRDTAAQAGVVEVMIETPGFQTYRHGHHHEFELIELSPAADALLGLCFCDACRQRARDWGLDADALARRAQAMLTALFADGTAPLPDLRHDPDWQALVACRCDTVTSLVAEVRAALPAHVRLAVIPSVQTPNDLCWREGSDLAALQRVCDRLEVPAYQCGPDAIGRDISAVRDAAGKDAALGFILRPTWPHVQGADDLAACVGLARRARADRISFYNYGHMRLQSLDWIAAAIRPENAHVET